MTLICGIPYMFLMVMCVNKLYAFYAYTFDERHQRNLYTSECLIKNKESYSLEKNDSSTIDNYYKSIKNAPYIDEDIVDNYKDELEELIEINKNDTLNDLKRLDEFHNINESHNREGSESKYVSNISEKEMTNQDNCRKSSHNKKRGYSLEKELEKLYRIALNNSNLNNNKKKEKHNKNLKDTNIDNDTNICVDYTYYDILNINANSNLEEIKEKYYEVASKYHPEKNIGNDKAFKNFELINSAYQILSNEELRKEYNSGGPSKMNNKKLIDPFVLFMLSYISINMSEYVGKLKIEYLIEESFETNSNFYELLLPNKIMNNYLNVEQKIREVELALLLRDRLETYLEGDENCIVPIKNHIKTILEYSFSFSIMNFVGWLYEYFSKLYIGYNIELSLMNDNKGIMENLFRNIVKKEMHRSLLNKNYVNITKDSDHFIIIDEKDHNNENIKNCTVLFNHIRSNNENNKNLEDMTRNVLILIILDIKLVIKRAVERVLCDKGVSQLTRKKRAKGLISLGKEIQNYTKEIGDKDYKIINENTNILESIIEDIKKYMEIDKMNFLKEKGRKEIDKIFYFVGNNIYRNKLKRNINEKCRLLKFLKYMINSTEE
ncbi:DnaJ protein, putative [Plasmodium reichenowi]|uniref:DnaJ protein, putative n=1 Tax=Plasmodium reichenowi TaxID=5854 RepID=A0A151LVC6_PLARE|nr:DnaJ protein, putative [Plasmodium reichenowi]KYO03127.1 DnaJ protein, putative [Plasmodium reichenowi]